MAEYISKSISSSNDKIMCCRFHEQEQYQLYCRDCRDLVCLECFQDKHLKHNVCRIRNAENDIRIYLRSELLEKEELDPINYQIDEAFTELTERRADVIEKIEQEADLRKKQIDLSKNRLVFNISSTCDKYISGIKIHERLLGLKEKITRACFLEFDVQQLVATMVEWREILEITSAIRKFSSSIKFEKNSSDVSLGNILSDSESGKRFDNLTKQKNFNTIFTQTETVDEIDEVDDEWFDADDKLDEDDLVEYSSDVESLEKYPIVIKINDDIKRIEKVIPISETNAWILADRKLRYMKDRILEEKIYATDIDDIGVLKNGNVLLLCHTQSYIMQLLPNETIVRFANAECASAFPRCLFVSQDDKYVIICSSKPEYVYNDQLVKYVCGYNIYHIKMSEYGVLIQMSQLNSEKIGPPCNVIEFQSQVCIVCQDLSNINLHSVRLFNVSNADNVSTHHGAIGYSPSSYFECYGICSDQSNNLLVSDFRHHCIYALDEKMKYKKSVATSRNELHDPTSIALWRNSLWIADKQQIFIFSYDSAESSLFV